MITGERLCAIGSPITRSGQSASISAPSDANIETNPGDESRPPLRLLDYVSPWAHAPATASIIARR